jgi:CPA2 family monovalent cation:H+ antiporter-2
VSAVIFKVALSVALLAGATMYLSRRRRINLPLAAVTAGGMDLTPIAALTWCFTFAAIAGLIGLSPAFGAFFAGLLVSSSQQRHMVAESAHAVQSVLLMVFFLSIGLLIDLNFLWQNLGAVILVWLFVAGFKTVLNTLVLRFMGEPTQRAFLSSLILAQLGEFSFVIGAAAIDRGVIDSDVYRMIVAVTVLSLVVSPLWLNAARRLHHRAAQRVPSLRRLVRLIYFREWRITRRVTGNVAAATKAVLLDVRDRIPGRSDNDGAAPEQPADGATPPEPVVAEASEPEKRAGDA